MIPGVDPRQLKAMMRQMGMSQEDIDAKEVIIKTSSGKVLVFNNPSVQKVTMKGQTTFQLEGSYVEEEEKVQVSISKDDIETVCEQAGVSVDVAKKALEKFNGDIAEAIVSLSDE